MKLPSTVVFADKSSERAFSALAEGDDARQELFEELKTAFENIERDAFCSINIPKRLMPKEYVQKHHIDNLWKYDLRNGWRLIYTIRKKEIIVIAVILEWLPHKEYERRFKY